MGHSNSEVFERSEIPFFSRERRHEFRRKRPPPNRYCPSSSISNQHVFWGVARAAREGAGSSGNFSRNHSRQSVWCACLLSRKHSEFTMSMRGFFVNSLGTEKYLPPPPPPREQEKKIFRGKLWFHPPLQ